MNRSGSDGFGRRGDIGQVVGQENRSLDSVGEVFIVETLACVAQVTTMLFQEMIVPNRLISRYLLYLPFGRKRFQRRIWENAESHDDALSRRWMYRMMLKTAPLSNCSALPALVHIRRTTLILPVILPVIALFHLDFFHDFFEDYITILAQLPVIYIVGTRTLPSCCRRCPRP